MGRKWRPHSPEYMSDHIEKLAKEYSVRHIHFEDDNLLVDMERFLKILDVLSRQKLTWDTPNGIQVKSPLDESILKKMSASGCKSLTIGVESGDEHILRHVVQKKISLLEVEEFAKRCNNVGLPLRAFFVLGFPGETLDTMEKTLSFALHLLKSYDVEIINLIATPLFGTELYELCEKEKYFSEEITPKSLSESTVSDGSCLIQTESFTSQDVERLSKQLTAKAFRLMLGKNLMHPLRSLRRVGNFYILKRTLKRMINFH
jgi:magnesium-protoporphyrin IX monomethyl ester (oxidative) cyclase